MELVAERVFETTAVEVSEALGSEEAGEETQPETAARILPEPVDFAPGVEVLPPSGEKARARANIAAIEMLGVLDSEQRYATAEEQQIIAQWSGWGAVPNIFDTSKSEWAQDRSRLESLLTSQQWNQARFTTVNAHYTDPAIVSVMWDALDRAGFSGGRVLEPGCGAGTFIGHAPESATMVGVELDSTTARIAAALYPSAQIRNEGFQHTRVPEDSFTATVGNVPFGALRLHDPAHNKSNLSIHNHFINKSLALTAPGGYVAVISSAFTADAADPRARKEMAERADLIGAVRLPTGAFARVAGTEVVTDVLVFRVREEDRERSEATAQFVTTGETGVRDDEGRYLDRSVNGYFAANPHNILGELVIGSGMYSNETLKVNGPVGAPMVEALSQRLTAIVDRARAEDLALTATIESTAVAGVNAFDQGLINGAERTGDDIAIDTLRWNEEEQQIQVYGRGGWEQATVRGAKKHDEWRQLLQMRDVAVTLVRSQLEERPRSERIALREELNSRYDEYLGRYGFINRFEWKIPADLTDAQHDRKLEKSIERWRAKEGNEDGPWQGEIPDAVYERLNDEAWEDNRRPWKKQTHLEGILRNDPTIHVVFAMENFDDETMRGNKAAIFATDVVSARAERREAATIDDALAISLDETRAVDVDRISELLSVPRPDVEKQLVGRAFRSLHDPNTWIPATSYLSGNVRTKLADAHAAAEQDPRYRPNVQALTEIQPPRKNDIDIKLGAPWVDPADYAQFIRETFEVPEGTTIKVERFDAQWSIHVAGYRGDKGMAEKWGVVPKTWTGQAGGFNFEDETADRLGIKYSGCARGDYDHITLLTSLCNMEPIRINKSKEYAEAAGGDLLHDKATRAAQNKARRIQQEFRTWALDADPDRRERLLDTYNELFNSTVAPQWDGSYQTFPGLGDKYAPYEYQRNAVARIVGEPSVLLDHVVGAGKSGTMFMGAMELKRLGLVRQPWIVVPNHIVEQIAIEASHWYPGARILSGSAATNLESRRRLVAQSATEDWDMVIVPQSAFKLIGVSNQTKADFIRDELDKLYEHRTTMETRESVKKLEIAIANAEERLNDTLDQTGKDAGLSFEESGGDYLFIDEAHMYKNLRRQSNVDELACAKGADQAMDLSMKLHYLRGVRRAEAVEAGIPEDNYVERVATFATGTPVANSLGELWVMTNYLRPDLLEAAGVAALDSWGATFTDTVESVELNSSGSKLVPKTRVGEFTNVGDLVAMTSVFTDVVMRDQVPVTLPVLDDGQRTVISFEPSQEVRDFITDLGHRASAADRRRPDIDNSLKIASDGRNVTLDPRTAHLDAPETGGRARILADQILEVREDTKDNIYLDNLGNESPLRGGLQIVFCDRSTPKAKSRAWNIYTGVKDELVAAGMDPESIRFIHDYAKASEKAKLYADCRNGRVAVVFGSTEKMGTGANIQPRAVALHHIDVPWRPADLEQREGRIIRQGNQNKRVQIFAYVAERTFDTFMWQTVQRKAHFIEQLKRADRTVRRVEDLGGDDLAKNAAAIKAIATGDPRYMRQVELDGAVADLQADADAHFAAARSRERELGALTTAIPGHQQAIAALTAAVPAVEAHLAAEGFSMTIAGQTFTKRPEASKALVHHLRETYGHLKGAGLDKVVTVATKGGLEIEVRRSMADAALYVGAKGLPLSTRVIPQEDMYVSVRANTTMTEEEREGAFGHLASGIMSRIERMVAEVPDKLDSRTWQLDTATARLEELQKQSSEDFPRSAELKLMYAELYDLQRQLREEENSPEAIARRAELQERLEYKGREPGWSLMLNATPALVEQLECVDADEVRAIMARREAEAAMERSRLAAVAESATVSDASTEQDSAPAAAEQETSKPGNADPDIAEAAESSPEPDSPSNEAPPTVIDLAHPTSIRDMLNRRRSSPDRPNPARPSTDPSVERDHGQEL
ncbi:helicase [Rhodococcus erythropolis]|nr:helicase [Rhodococcus erythropolis]